MSNSLKNKGVDFGARDARTHGDNGYCIYGQYSIPHTGLSTKRRTSPPYGLDFVGLGPFSSNKPHPTSQYNIYQYLYTPGGLVIVHTYT